MGWWKDGTASTIIKRITKNREMMLPSRSNCMSICLSVPQKLWIYLDLGIYAFVNDSIRFRASFKTIPLKFEYKTLKLISCAYINIVVYFAFKATQNVAWTKPYPTACKFWIETVQFQSLVPTYCFMYYY